MDCRLSLDCKRRFLKALYLAIRLVAHRFYARSRMAEKLYSWADLRIFKTCRDCVVLPGWVWRSIAALLNWIAGINTIDTKRLQSKKLQRYISAGLHRVLKKYRYPKMRPFTASTIGQDGA
jgi:hypothetical protein